MDKSAIIALSLVAGLLALYGSAFAHGTEKHGKMVPADAQMKKLHDMMPVFSVASAECESALDKGDTAAAKASADRILAATSDLKKCKPHKNVKQHKKFVVLATNFEKTVTSTVDLINKDDLSGAKAAFKKVEEVCASCHAKFRD